MATIVAYPEVVSESIPFFRDLFSGRQVKHCSEYLAGLIISDEANVSEINRIFLDANDQSSLNRFLTEYEWSEKELNDRRLEFLQQSPATAWKSYGVMSIDDVLLEKTGKHIAGVGKFFNHSEGRFCLGQNLVTSHYADREKHYPIDYGLYLKEDSDEAKREGFSTKIRLACMLVEDAVKRRIPAKTFVFDSWFMCNELTALIEKNSKDWISKLKSNRLVRCGKEYVQTMKFAKAIPPEKFSKTQIGKKTYWTYTKVVMLKDCEKKVRIVVSYDNEKLEGEPEIFVTNRTDWHSKGILTIYSKRWTVETFYRDAKQNLGLGDSQLRTLAGIRRHWYLVLTAYSLLKRRICESSLGRRAISVRTIGEACRSVRMNALENLVLWVHKNLKQGAEIQEILGVLLSK
jgi:SRSO17 transposase